MREEALAQARLFLKVVAELFRQAVYQCEHGMECKCKKGRGCASEAAKTAKSTK